MTMEMTIEQAIKYTSKLKKKISDARSRAQTSLNHKYGAPTAFDFEKMLKLADSQSFVLAEVQGKLAVANATNFVEYNGKTISLAHAVRILQELKGRIAWLNSLPSLASESIISNEKNWDDVSEKYVTTQVTTICHLPEAKQAEMADSIQDEFDTLNGAINSINQTVKLAV